VAFGAKGRDLYVGTFSGALLSVDANNGTFKWAYANDGAIDYCTAAVGADDTIYVGNSESIWALSDKGTLKWLTHIYARVDSSPALSDDGTMLYFGANNYNLFAISTTDGRYAWQFTSQGPFSTNSPTVVGSGEESVIYIGSADTMYAVSATTGALKWSFKAGSSISTTAAVTSDGSLIIFAAGPSIYAISPLGAQVWQSLLALASSPMSSPALSSDDTFIYIGDAKGDVHSLSVQNGGKAVWSYHTEGPIASAPTISADGTVILVGSFDGFVHAVDAVSGLGLWKQEIGASVMSSPVVDQSGRVFVTADNGHIVAIDTH